MKGILKLGLAAVLAATTLIAAFSFTSSSKSTESKKPLTLPRYFKYTGAIPQTSTSLTNPLSWTEVPSFVTVDHVHNVVAEIKVINNESTYIYPTTDPNFPDRPKVDVNPSTFRSDVLKAGGFGSPATIQEVFKTDYEIYNNTSILP